MNRFPIIFGGMLLLSACAVLKGSEKASQVIDQKTGDVYAQAITDGYSYMFSSSNDFSINGKDVGMFEAGFQGLFLYSDFKDGLSKHYGIKEENDVDASYYNLSIYQQWLGMDMFVTGEKSYHGYKNSHPEQLFHQYNPKLIVWATKNLIPDPTDSIGDRTAQEVYDNVMSRFCRLMTITYRHFRANDPDQMIADYSVEFEKPEDQTYGAMNHLMERYDPIFPEYGTWDGTTFTGGMAMGFWMRRSLDGTMDEFWKAFEKIMNAYDSKWFKK